METIGLSQTKVCAVATCNRKTFRRVLRRLDDGPLLERLRELAAERRRFGYRRLGVMLRRDGIAANHKRVFRVYQSANLRVRKRTKRRVAFGRGEPPIGPTCANRARSDRRRTRLPEDDRHGQRHGDDEPCNACMGGFASSTLALHRAWKPTQNAFIESFNGRFRDECLNEHLFMTLAEARRTIETWREDYNARRPHKSLGHLTPNEFAQYQSQVA